MGPHLKAWSELPVRRHNKELQVSIFVFVFFKGIIAHLIGHILDSGLWSLILDLVIFMFLINTVHDSDSIVSFYKCLRAIKAFPLIECNSLETS